MQSLWGAKALTRWASQTQQGRPWGSALKPQGSLANKCNKGVVRASWVLRWYSYCNGNYHCRDINCHNACAINTKCNVLPTSGGATGCTLDATTTIAVVIMVDTSSASSVTRAVAATNKRDNKKSPPSVRTRAISPATYTTSTPITRCTNPHNQVCEQQQQVEATKMREKTKPSWHVRHMSRVQGLLDKQQFSFWEENLVVPWLQQLI
jgi:hypothetical protein